MRLLRFEDYVYEASAPDDGKWVETNDHERSVLTGPHFDRKRSVPEILADPLIVHLGMKGVPGGVRMWHGRSGRDAFYLAFYRGKHADSYVAFANHADTDDLDRILKDIETKLQRNP